MSNPDKYLHHIIFFFTKFLNKNERFYLQDEDIYQIMYDFSYTYIFQFLKEYIDTDRPSYKEENKIVEVSDIDTSDYKKLGLSLYYIVKLNYFDFSHTHNPLLTYQLNNYSSESISLVNYLIEHEANNFSEFLFISQEIFPNTMYDPKYEDNNKRLQDLYKYLFL